MSILKSIKIIHLYFILFFLSQKKKDYRCHAKCSSLAPFSCTCTHRKEK